MRWSVPVLISAFTFATPAAASPVLEQLDDGTWMAASWTGDFGETIEEHAIWVDFAAWNLSYEKDIGILWTDDGWATSHLAHAWYEGGLPDGREQWGVDIIPHSTLVRLPVIEGIEGGPEQVQQPITVEYVIYYTVGGWTHWDNNGGANYTLVIE